MIREAKLPADFPPPGPTQQVIIKHYPPCRMATVRRSEVDGKGDDRLFMPLFNHIQSRKISMTSPVVMDFVAAPAGTSAPATSASASAAPAIEPAQPPVAMSFVYATTQTGQVGTDGLVSVHDAPAMTVLSVGVRGSYDAVRFRLGMKLIAQWLTAHAGQYEIVGPPRFLGYNSPFVPWFLRFGEVQVPVRRI